MTARVVVAGAGALLGVVLSTPAFCVTQHSDPGPTSTRCQALVHWLPPLRDSYAPRGLGAVAFVAAGAAAGGLLLWLLAASLGRSGRRHP